MDCTNTVPAVEFDLLIIYFIMKWKCFIFIISSFFFQPCIDESDLEEDPSWKVMKFGRSPLMSTYLVAFFVGEFDVVSGKDSDGVHVCVYTPVGKKEQGRFALEVFIFFISYFYTDCLAH